MSTTPVSPALTLATRASIVASGEFQHEGISAPTSEPGLGGLCSADDGEDSWPSNSATSARGLLIEMHKRAPKDVAVCAGIGIVPFPTPHKLSRAAHEARALAIRAAREWYLETARDYWIVHHALVSIRCGVLGDRDGAERFRKYAAKLMQVSA